MSDLIKLERRKREMNRPQKFVCYSYKVTNIAVKNGDKVNKFSNIGNVSFDKIVFSELAALDNESHI